MKKHLRIIGVEPPRSKHRVYSPDRALSHPSPRFSRLPSKSFFNFVYSLLHSIQPTIFRFEDIHPILLGFGPQIDSTIAQAEELSAARAQSEYVSLNCEELDNAINHLPFSG